MERLDDNIYPYGREAGVITPFAPFELYDNTPIEYYPAYEVYVKREDKCSNIERFSKARGFLIELSDAKAKGYKEIGWEEAGDYRAAKCVASICQKLDLNLTIWGKPIHKLDLRVQQVASERLLDIEKYGAKVIFYDRKYLVKIHWYMHKKLIPYMIPLGGDKTFMRYAISKEVERTNLTDFTDIVVCCSTGGLLQGILQGISNLPISIHCVLIQDRKPIKLSEAEKQKVTFINNNWEYYDLSKQYPEEFPCNLQYDAKAWEWLINNRFHLGKKVLFWNAGA